MCLKKTKNRLMSERGLGVAEGKGVRVVRKDVFEESGIFKLSPQSV